MDYAYIRNRARELRKNQTPEEGIVWAMLRNRKFHGLKFLRQHPIEYYAVGRRCFFIADFYCAEKKIVLELDGKIHDRQQERDSERDVIMRNLGIEVLRIKNEEIQDREQVKLLLEVAMGISSSPSLLAERGSGGE